jgi:hypothetical protein
MFVWISKLVRKCPLLLHLHPGLGVFPICLFSTFHNKGKCHYLLLELPSSRHVSMLLWTYCLSLGLASSHSHHHVALCTSVPGHVLGCRAAGLFDRNQIEAMNYTEKSLHFSMLLSQAHPFPMKSSSLTSICRVADGLDFDD